MAFSRGLYTGWLRGINNQELVHANFGKKRGVYVGEVTRIKNEQITLKIVAPIKAGDGVVFDCGHPELPEEGGRVYTVTQKGKEVVLTFGRDAINPRKIHIGDKIWKTSDPELDKAIRQTYTGENPHFTKPIHLELFGETGEKLIAIVRDEIGNIVKIESEILLVEAHTKPLTAEKLQEQFGRLGNTPFHLGTLENKIMGNVILPVSELNRMRRELVTRLQILRSKPQVWQINHDHQWQDLLKIVRDDKSVTDAGVSLIILVRSMKQLLTVLDTNIETIYCEFEDPHKYQAAVKLCRDTEKSVNLYIAPPRITKPGENWILKQLKECQADGYLVRNYDHLEYFADAQCIGDFSLNIANPLSADYFQKQFNLQRLTASYDLNINQLIDLITTYTPQFLEVTIHQHIPMFHIEHCVFCAFLSQGTDYTNCGRPCEKQELKIRDRVGSEHIVKADTGCRNTIYNSAAQTGAEYVHKLISVGLKNFRIEFLDETPQQVTQTINYYQQLIQGEITGSQVWKTLKLQNQLGVTRGALTDH